MLAATPWGQPLFLLATTLILRCFALPTPNEPAQPTLTNETCHLPTNETLSKTLRSYLQNPSDFTTILLIIGGDIIQKALAQLSGSRFGAPIAFSFGWVSYSFSALASVVGDGRLMPEPEFPSLVANTSSGYVRNNGSWILTRLLRDLERNASKGKGGLSVTILNSIGRGGEPKKDWVWYIGVIVIPLQFVISLIPWILRDDWTIFLLTFSGTLLAFSVSVLPQWSAEKWCCRRRNGSYSLTRGNGHRNVFVIQNLSQEGLNFEDVAASHVQLSSLAEWFSRVFLSITAMLWLIFIICAGGIETDIWFLLAVGFLGMLQNIIVAGATRSPRAHGINLEQKEIIEGSKVMRVLQDVELRYPRVGLSLLKIFFPGDLWADEEKFWTERKRELEVQKNSAKSLRKRTTS